MKGTVKWFSLEKGYGYISSEPDHIDHFFHVSDVEGPDLPRNADLVHFQSENGEEKGARATNIKIIQRAENNPNPDTSDKALCLSCDKYMVPQVVFENGRPSYSICPFCQAHYYPELEGSRDWTGAEWDAHMKMLEEKTTSSKRRDQKEARDQWLSDWGEIAAMVLKLLIFCIFILPAAVIAFVWLLSA